MLGNDSDNGLLGGIIILLTTGSVLSVLVVLVVWKKFWLRAADHEDDNDSEGGNRTALCSCCNSHDNSSVTPGTGMHKASIELIQPFPSSINLLAKTLHGATYLTMGGS